MLPGWLQVYALVDSNGIGRADQLRAVVKGLDHPNGLAWLGGALYVMTNTLLLRYDDIDTYALSGKVSTSSCRAACRTFAARHHRILAPSTCAPSMKIWQQVRAVTLSPTLP